MASTNLKRRFLRGLREEPQAMCTPPEPSGVTRLRCVLSRDSKDSTKDSCDLHQTSYEKSRKSENGRGIKAGSQYVKRYMHHVDSSGCTIHKR